MRTKGIVKPVDAKLLEQAAFLKGWSKGKDISLWQDGSCCYKSGKWMTKLGNTPKEALATAQALIDANLATGNKRKFKII